MADIRFLTPLDQPLGRTRLLDRLRQHLRDPQFREAIIAVAYAKAGPLLRLHRDIVAWQRGGKKITAVFGLDQQGTSEEALRYALSNFNEVFVTFAAGATFHPKVYLFRGPSKASITIGSNNLTVGGLEQNFESAIELLLNLPEDQAVYEDAIRFLELIDLPACRATSALNEELLSQLKGAGLLSSEKSGVAKQRNSDAKKYSTSLSTVLGARGFSVVPPSPIPGHSMPKAKAGSTKSAGAAPPPEAVHTKGLAIQVVPHHNGEIFLSKIAVNQNCGFFGFPFSGSTTPKKGANKAYPQRSPDPVVSLTVIGAQNKKVLEIAEYGLNTVYYDRKGEIRITASPLVDVVPAYSIMVMEEPEGGHLDYELTIYTPDSPEYDAWLQVCNQVMPSGGAATPRRFGWF